MCRLVLLRLQTYLRGHACLSIHLMLVTASARRWSGKIVSLASLALPYMLCGAAAVASHSDCQVVCNHVRQLSRADAHASFEGIVLFVKRAEMRCHASPCEIRAICPDHKLHSPKLHQALQHISLQHSQHSCNTLLTDEGFMQVGMFGILPYPGVIYPGVLWYT